MAKRRDPNSRHYVDNKEFLIAITAYRERVQAAKAAGEQKPRVTEYLGECMVKIGNHLAYKSNFVNYTFRDEMILDGIENCITYIDNFDPEKSKNPFAYFTQITYYAFIRRIQKEKKQMDTKKKFIGSLDMQELMMSAWAEFAKTGAPKLPIDWPEFSAANRDFVHLDVDNALRVSSDRATMESLLNEAKRSGLLSDIELCILVWESVTKVGETDYDGYADWDQGRCSEVDAEAEQTAINKALIAEYGSTGVL